MMFGRTKLRDLPGRAKTTLSNADLLIETARALVGEVADGITITIVKRPGMKLFSAVWALFTEEGEVAVPIELRIELKEDDQP